jgi:hypothetical protein
MAQPKGGRLDLCISTQIKEHAANAVVVTHDVIHVWGTCAKVAFSSFLLFRLSIGLILNY